MTKVTDYDKALEVPLKSLVHFKEYALDRHERKQLLQEIDGELFTILSPEERLSADSIRVYYPELHESSYHSVSHSPFIRLVIQIGASKLGIPIYRTVTLNKYFMMVGLQTVEYEEMVIAQPTVPNQILGFNSYDIGNKFKV